MIKQKTRKDRLFFDTMLGSNLVNKQMKKEADTVTPQQMIFSVKQKCIKKKIM